MRTSILLLSLLFCSQSFGESPAYFAGFPTAADISKSVPLDLSAGTVEMQGTTLDLVPLTFENPILGRVYGVISDVCVDRKRILAMVKRVGIYAYHMPEPGSTALVLDKTFGKEGFLEVDAKFTQTVAADGKGRVYANGRGHQVFQDGKLVSGYNRGRVACQSWTGRGFVHTWDSSGSHIRSLTDGKVGPKALAVESGRPPIGWAGGSMAMRISPEGYRNRSFIRLLHTEGPVDLSNPKKPYAPDGICNIRAITGTSKFVAVLDDNCEKVVFFDHSGKHLGHFKGRDFGMGAASWTTLAMDGAGMAYLAGFRTRASTDGNKTTTLISESIILRIEGLDKLP